MSKLTPSELEQIGRFCSQSFPPDLSLTITIGDLLKDHMEDEIPDEIWVKVNQSLRPALLLKYCTASVEIYSELLKQ